MSQLHQPNDPRSTLIEALACALSDMVIANSKAPGSPTSPTTSSTSPSTPSVLGFSGPDECVFDAAGATPVSGIHAINGGFHTPAQHAQQQSNQEPQQQVVTKFSSSYPPDVSIRTYLKRIKAHANCSDSVFVLALVYIDRVISLQGMKIDALNVHRILITSIMLAAKFLDDLFYNNAFYAKLGGITLSEINSLEIELLKLLRFSLYVDSDTYIKYENQLKSYVDKKFPVNQAFQLQACPDLAYTQPLLPLTDNAVSADLNQDIQREYAQMSGMLAQQQQYESVQAEQHAVQSQQMHEQQQQHQQQQAIQAQTVPMASSFVQQQQYVAPQVYAPVPPPQQIQQNQQVPVAHYPAAANANMNANVNANMNNGTSVPNVSSIPNIWTQAPMAQLDMFGRRVPMSQMSNLMVPHQPQQPVQQSHQPAPQYHGQLGHVYGYAAQMQMMHHHQQGHYVGQQPVRQRSPPRHSWVTSHSPSLQGIA